MKKWIKWYCAALIALVVTTVMSSCHRKYASESKHSITEYVDSADLAKILGEYDNPKFTSLDDVYTYYQNEKQYRMQDSVFFSMPPETVANVYTVLVRRGEKSITKMSITNEYLDNIKVYSNLPKKVEMDEALGNGMPDVPNTVTIDTIINGEHVKVMQESTQKLADMKVIAIIYDGSEVPSEILGTMKDNMSRFVTNDSQVIFKTFNENDLVNLGIQASVSAITFDVKNDAVEHASNYISTRFSSFLNQPVRLVLAMSNVKNSTTEEATILKNAVSIICENPTNPVLKKNGITASVVKVIKEFNTSYNV